MAVVDTVDRLEKGGGGPVHHANLARYSDRKEQSE